MTQIDRKIGFLAAEKTMKRKYVGSLARMLNASKSRTLLLNYAYLYNEKFRLRELWIMLNLALEGYA